MSEESAAAPLTVSVVVPTIGRAVMVEVVRRTLAQDPLEVIVVADREPDRVQEMLAGDGLDDDPRVRVVPGPGRGAAPARQAGVGAAAGDVILFLDDDVVPDPGLVAGHRDAHAGTAGRVVVGYIPVASDLVRDSVTAAIYSADYEAECRELDGHPELVLLALWGGSVSMRRTDCLRVPQAVPTFDGLLLEDTELGLRCAQAGLVGVFDRRLAAVHHHNQSIEMFLRNSARQMAAAQILARQYPGLAPPPDPVAPLPAYARVLVRTTGAPVVGRPLRAAVVRVATRLGRGRATPLRIKAAVFARVVVQLEAIRSAAGTPGR
ncbi:MAG: glycosyltransferase [Acidimicrobiia bacterium]